MSENDDVEIAFRMAVACGSLTLYRSMTSSTVSWRGVRHLGREGDIIEGHILLYWRETRASYSRLMVLRLAHVAG